MAVLARRKDNPEARMSLGGHFREFRNRALIAVVAILIGTVVGWMHYQDFYNFMHEPLAGLQRKHPDTQIALNFPGLTSTFNLKFKASMWMGFIFASPVWLWEIWAFLVPAMTPKEKRIGGGFVLAALALFGCGVYLGSQTFATAIDLLLTATPDHATNLLSASDYFSFVTRFILAFGLVFLLPVFLMAFNMAGVLPGRLMLKGWRIAVIAITTFAAVMTPTPDVWTMFIMAAPLLVLYFGSAGLAILLDKRKNKHRPDYMELPDDVASPL